MPRLFDGVDDTLRLLGPSTSPLVGFDAGPCTVALVLQPVANADEDDTLFALFDSESSSHTVATYTRPINGYGISNGSSAHAYTHILAPDDGWGLMIVTKAGGSSVTRFHRYKYSQADWFHGDAIPMGDSLFPVVNAPMVDFGSDSDSFANFHVAAAGVWNRVLSDAECETMPFQITNWLNLPGGGPLGCWTFSQASVSDPVLDLTGNGLNQLSITGTTVSGLISPINEGTYQYVRPAAIAADRAVPGPTVSAIIQEVEPDGISGSATVGEPVVDLGPEPQDLAPETIAGAPALLGPTITLGTAPTYWLNVPTTRQPIARSGLWKFFAVDPGQTLVKEDGTWRLVRSPRDDLLSEFEGVYRGGYQHIVTALEAVELIRDGFEDALEPIP